MNKVIQWFILLIELIFAYQSIKIKVFSSVLRVAVQKSGRLSEESIRLLQECGLKFSLGSQTLKCVALNYPIEILLLRDDDIPGYVEDGVAELGIVGENVVLEKQKNIDTLIKLGFGKCRLSLAVPKNTIYQSINDLNGKSIATSYPNILHRFLDENNVECDIHEISGSVEIAPGIGLADAICDLVSSGSTLLTNGLTEAEVILKSEAILIKNQNIASDKLTILDDFMFRIRSVLTGKEHKYVLLNAPNESLENIIKILPGMKSPTVLPLAMSGWSSVHSVIEEKAFWEKIQALKEAGAQGILVVPIEKMIV